MRNRRPPDLTDESPLDSRYLYVLSFFLSFFFFFFFFPPSSESRSLNILKEFSLSFSLAFSFDFRVSCLGVGLNRRSTGSVVRGESADAGTLHAALLKSAPRSLFRLNHATDRPFISSCSSARSRVESRTIDTACTLDAASDGGMTSRRWRD